MTMPPGVFTATKKDGSTYYRVSVTHKNKHISLGSYDDCAVAAQAYKEASSILKGKLDIANPLVAEFHYRDDCPLSFEKWIILINFRDNGIYFKTPIYLFRKYFFYYLTRERVLKFDADDLFYYSNHKIMARNGYLFVNDYGSQTSILSRYGIQSHSVLNRDYYFANGDTNDFRYGNIVIVNKYHGVQSFFKNGTQQYKVKIHINGDFVVGTYNSEAEAAIAYNKAADTLHSNGFEIAFPVNYVEETSNIEYAKIYNNIRISKKIRALKKVRN